jgi:hypothetical protein
MPVVDDRLLKRHDTLHALALRLALGDEPDGDGGGDRKPASPVRGAMRAVAVERFPSFVLTETALHARAAAQARKKTAQQEQAQARPPTSSLTLQMLLRRGRIQGGLRTRSAPKQLDGQPMLHSVSPLPPPFDAFPLPPERPCLSLPVSVRYCLIRAACGRAGEEQGRRRRSASEHHDLFAAEYVWEPVDPCGHIGFDVRTYFGFCALFMGKKDVRLPLNIPGNDRLCVRPPPRVLYVTFFSNLSADMVFLSEGITAHWLFTARSTGTVLKRKGADLLPDKIKTCWLRAAEKNPKNFERHVAMLYDGKVRFSVLWKPNRPI